MLSSFTINMICLVIILLIIYSLFLIYELITRDVKKSICKILDAIFIILVISIIVWLIYK